MFHRELLILQALRSLADQGILQCVSVEQSGIMGRKLFEGSLKTYLDKSEESAMFSIL